MKQIISAMVLIILTSTVAYYDISINEVTDDTISKDLYLHSTIQQLTSDALPPAVGKYCLKKETKWNSKNKPVTVPLSTMKSVYDKIKTPFKYGLVLVPPDKNKMVDSPSIFQYKDTWYMIYIIYDGTGYETWMAKSSDLLSWETLGRLLSFTADTWDSNQKAGYIALQDYTWGGNYEIETYDNKYWMSYLGGDSKGYEAGLLSVGIAYTDTLTEIKEWERLKEPVLTANDPDARWYDNTTIYKSTVIHDKNKTTGYPFVMFYNAKGEVQIGDERPERIALAVSEDMINWKRHKYSPLINHNAGISGDAFITKIDNVWVMFYFGAFWEPNAFERFACSFDLVHWTKWDGDDLISPSEEYDNLYAHKPCVIKHDGIVYHFYCAVNKKGERSIALATSKYIGESSLNFPN